LLTKQEKYWPKKKEEEEGNRLENRAELAPKVDASCQQTNHKYHDKKKRVKNGSQHEEA